MYIHLIFLFLFYYSKISTKSFGRVLGSDWGLLHPPPPLKFFTSFFWFFSRSIKFIVGLFGKRHKITLPWIISTLFYFSTSLTFKFFVIILQVMWCRYTKVVHVNSRQFSIHRIVKTTRVEEKKNWIKPLFFWGGGRYKFINSCF